MSRGKALVKSTGIFALGNIGSKVLVLLLLPFCTYYVDPSGVGLYDLIYSIVEVLKPIASLAIPEALFRWLLDKKMNRQEVLASWLRLYLLISVGFLVAYISVWLILRFPDALIVFLMIQTGTLYLGCQFATRGLHSNVIFALQGILYSVVLCATSLVFVAPLNLGYIGLMLGVLCGNLSAIIFMIVLQRKKIQFSFSAANKTNEREMLKYSIMLLPNNVCWWFVNSFGRVVVTVFLGVAANGVFSIASRFPVALNMVTQIFQQAWTEQAVAEYDSPDRDEYFSSVFDMYAKLIVCSTIVLIPLTRLFLDLFLDEIYFQAAEYLGVLYLGSMFSAFSSFLGTGYICGKNTKGAASTSLLGASANIVMSLLAVQVWGAIGVALSLMLSQLIILLVRMKHSKEFFSVKFDLRVLFGGSCGCLVLTFLIARLDFAAIVAVLIICVAIFFSCNRAMLRLVLSDILETRDDGIRPRKGHDGKKHD